MIAIKRCCLSVIVALAEEIQWYEMCESTPITKEQARVCFGDLSNAFKVLHHQSSRWSEDDIISVMEELTSKRKGPYKGADSLLTEFR